MRPEKRKMSASDIASKKLLLSLHNDKPKPTVQKALVALLGVRKPNRGDEEANVMASLKDAEKKKFTRKGSSNNSFTDSQHYIWAIKGLKRMIDQARDDICRVAGNPYFLENDKKMVAH